MNIINEIKQIIDKMTYNGNKIKYEIIPSHYKDDKFFIQINFKDIIEIQNICQSYKNNSERIRGFIRIDGNVSGNWYTEIYSPSSRIWNNYLNWLNSKSDEIWGFENYDYTINHACQQICSPAKTSIKNVESILTKTLDKCVNLMKEGYEWSINPGVLNIKKITQEFNSKQQEIDEKIRELNKEKYDLQRNYDSVLLKVKNSFNKQKTLLKEFK